MSTVGIETKSFNAQIEEKIKEIDPNLKLELKTVKLILNPINFDIDAKTIGPNLFYRSKKRIEAIKSHLTNFNPFVLFGYDENHLVEIENLKSDRRIVDKRGIAVADVVFVPLEDGDRAEILKENGKTIITVDLNPLSRTAKMSDVTIIDNIVRVVPLISKYISEMNERIATEIIREYNNNEIIQKALNEISKGFLNKFSH